MKKQILLFSVFYFSLSPAQDNKNLLSPKPIYGTREIDSLKNVLKIQGDDTNKVNTLNDLSDDLELLGNYDSSLSYFEISRKLAEKIAFKKGLADALMRIGAIYYDRGNYAKDLGYQFKSFNLYQEIGNKHGLSSTLTNLGLVYWQQGNYSKALEYHLKALSIAQEIGNKKSISTCFCNIGIIYSDQGNLPKALEYLFKSLDIVLKIGDKHGISIALGNIGDAYLAQGNYAKALEYDTQALTETQEIGDKDNMAIDLDNIGNIYYDKNDYPKALEYNFKALSIAQEIGDNYVVADLYSNIGAVYTKLKNYKQAKAFLDSARILSKNTGDKKITKNTYYKLVTLDSALGNYKVAYEDYIQYITYRDSLVNQESVEKITQMEIAQAFEKREDSIKTEQEKTNIIKTAEIKRKRIINNGVIIILILIILLTILLISRQQIKRKKDKLLFEIEKHHMETELANAKVLLDEYIKNLMEKNTLLEQSNADLENIKNLKAREIDENRIEHLENLNHTTILTEEDWNKFKKLFEQVHKGFFIRLKEKLPELTQAEIRLVCLTKLKLDTKHMGAILGVSPNTILTSRYRLRKKLGLSEKDSLDDIPDSI